MSVRTVQDTEALIAALKACGCQVVKDDIHGCVLEKTFTSRARLHIYPDGECSLSGDNTESFRLMKALLTEHDNGRKAVQR